MVRSVVSQTIKSLIAESSPLGKFVAKCQLNSSATFGSKLLPFSEIRHLSWFQWPSKSSHHTSTEILLFCVFWL